MGKVTYMDVIVADYQIRVDREPRQIEKFPALGRILKYFAQRQWGKVTYMDVIVVDYQIRVDGEPRQIEEFPALGRILKFFALRQWGLEELNGKILQYNTDEP